MYFYTNKQYDSVLLCALKMSRVNKNINCGSSKYINYTQRDGTSAKIAFGLVQYNIMIYVNTMNSKYWNLLLYKVIMMILYWTTARLHASSKRYILYLFNCILVVFSSWLDINNIIQYILIIILLTKVPIKKFDNFNRRHSIISMAVAKLYI